MFGHTLRELEEGSLLTTIGLGYFKLSSGRDDDDVFVIYETRIYYWFSYFNNKRGS
jgi:hypothetical protein